MNTNDTAPALLPCPFCGGEVERILAALARPVQPIPASASNDPGDAS